MIPSNSVHVLLLQAVSLFSEVSVRQTASLSPESATYGHSCLQESQLSGNSGRSSPFTMARKPGTWGIAFP